jgi:UDP-N-acetylmuramoyl-tripeptide--D-alanyl-D-alanine ligase
MGNLLGVAETKGAIYEALSDDGVAVINADDTFAPFFAQIVGHRRSFRFGIENDADVRATKILTGADGSQFTLNTPAGDAEIALPLPGRHNVMNALAATALALGAGAPFDAIVEGLRHAEPVKGRPLAHVLASGAVLIDDSYNANPGSVIAAISTLSQDGGNAWLVLGDMAELGEDEAALHAEVGAQAKRAGLARLFTIGRLSAEASRAFGAGARHFQRQPELIEALRGELTRGVRCLVKGSRSSAMDNVVKALLKQEQQGTGHAA